MVAGKARKPEISLVDAPRYRRLISGSAALLSYCLRINIRLHLRRVPFPAIVHVLTFQYRNLNCDEENDP
jgi:hypothetical protein